MSSSSADSSSADGDSEASAGGPLSAGSWTAITGALRPVGRMAGLWSIAIGPSHGVHDSPGGSASELLPSGTVLRVTSDVGIHNSEVLRATAP